MSLKYNRKNTRGGETLKLQYVICGIDKEQRSFLLRVEVGTCCNVLYFIYACLKVAQSESVRIILYKLAELTSANVGISLFKPVCLFVCRNFIVMTHEKKLNLQ